MNHQLRVITRTIRELDEKLGSWLFFAALALLLLSFSWFWTFGTPIDFRLYSRYSMISAMAMAGVRMGLLSWKHPRYVLGCAAVILLLFYSSCLSHEKTILCTFVIVAAAKDEDINRILKLYLVIYLIVLLVFPILYQMGWTSDIVKHKMGRVGHSWGFINPNRFAFFMQMLVFLILAIKRIGKTWLVALVCWGAAIMIGWMTLSMTSLVVLLMLPVLYACFRRYNCPVILLILTPPILTLLSIGFSLFYGPSTGDTTFESRFSIPHLIFDEHGLSWLGQHFKMVSSWDAIRTGAEPFYMNNLYLSLVLCDGVITALVVMALYGYYLYRMARLNDPLLLAMAVSMAIAGLMQMFPLFIALNFPLFFHFQKPMITEGKALVGHIQDHQPHAEAHGCVEDIVIKRWKKSF